jgi:hypothetical protein
VLEWSVIAAWSMLCWRRFHLRRRPTITVCQTGRQIIRRRVGLWQEKQASFSGNLVAGVSSDGGNLVRIATTDVMGWATFAAATKQ